MEFTAEDKKMAKALSMALTVARSISEIIDEDHISYPLNSLQPLIDLLDKIGKGETDDKISKEESVDRMHVTYTTMLTQEGIVYDLAKKYGVQPKDVVIEVQKNGTVGATITNIPGEI